MLNNFINAKTKELFLEQLGSGNILDEAIVFIEDSKEISTHGTVYKTVNWSVLEPNIKNYMRFVAVEDSVIKLTGMDAQTGESITDADIQYSMDGKNWIQYDYVGISLAAGETLYMKGNNPNGLSGINTMGEIAYMFGDITGSGNGSTGKFECHGNIMSLIYGDDFEGQMNIPSVACFIYLFAGTGLITAPELPAMTLTDACYHSMFQGCTSLTIAPELPATTLAERCYSSMFDGCILLETTPELPATTLADYCYQNMFSGCTSLNNITMLATDVSASSCLNNWVNGVSSTGTFVKNAAMTSLPTGASGIPEGWTVEDAVIS